MNEFGKEGSGEGNLNSPLCIATTWNEKLFISDKNFCVSIFSQDGRYVRCLGFSNKASKGQLQHPHGVASKSNTIYVTDLINRRVLLLIYSTYVMRLRRLKLIVSYASYLYVCMYVHNTYIHIRYNE